jgi:hypothetical protein
MLNHSNSIYIEKEENMIKINAPARDFTENAYSNDQEKKISVKDYRW